MARGAAFMNETAERPRWLPHEEFPFESRFVEVGGNRLHYIDEGFGPVALFVHAGPAWSFVFRGLIERLRDEFRCIALDFPGSGLSKAATGYRPSLGSATDVLEGFVESLGLRDVTLVANDLGGPVALGVAARRPELARAIAVIEAFGWPLGEENPKVVRILRAVGSGFSQAVNDATNTMALLTSTKLGLGRRLTRRGRRAFRGPYRDRAVRRNALLMLGDAAASDEHMRAVDGALHTGLRDRPMLLVFGAKSPAVKEEFPERWKARFPDARLLIVEGAHHFPQMDAPDLVAATFHSWWREIADAR